MASHSYRVFSPEIVHSKWRTCCRNFNGEFPIFPSVSTDGHFINPTLHVIILDIQLDITISMNVHAINWTILKRQLEKNIYLYYYYYYYYYYYRNQ